MDKVVGKRMYPDHQQRGEEQRNGVREPITCIFSIKCKPLTAFWEMRSMMLHVCAPKKTSILGGDRSWCR